MGPKTLFQIAEVWALFAFRSRSVDLQNARVLFVFKLHERACFCVHDVSRLDNSLGIAVVNRRDLAVVARRLSTLGGGHLVFDYGGERSFQRRMLLSLAD